jgi:hypothetical protein
VSGSGLPLAAALLCAVQEPPPDATSQPDAQVIRAAQPTPKQEEPAPGREEPRPGEWFFRVFGRYEHAFATDLDGGGSVSDDGIRLGLTASTLVSRDVQLELSLGYGLDLYDFDGTGGLAGLDPWDDVHRLGVRARVNWTINNDWILFGGADVLFARETDASWDSSITGGGLLGATYVFGEDLQLGLGLFVGSQLEENALVVPAFVLNWNISERWSISSQGRAGVTGGTGAELIWYPGGRDGRWELAMGARWDLRRFRLDDQGIAPDGVGEDSSLPLWFRVSWGANENFSLDLYGGFILSGSMEVVDTNGNGVSSDNYDPAPFAGLAVRVSF